MFVVHVSKLDVVVLTVDLGGPFPPGVKTKFHLTITMLVQLLQSHRTQVIPHIKMSFQILGASTLQMVSLELTS